MHGNRYFVDTNVLIYLLSGDNTLISILNQKQIYISFITEIELLSFADLTVKERNKIVVMLKNFIVMDINESIKETTIRYRKDFKLKTPDAIIAATANYLNLPLLTADLAFKSIPELTTIIYSH